MTKRRLAFMGTPDFAVAILDALIAAGHEIAAVYCRPPRRAGRGHRLVPSPVEQRAREKGLLVRHPARLGPEECAEFTTLDLDVAVVAAYGLLLPKPVLAAPKLGCINVHASLLPRWRGAAPIERAILAGDKETGVAIMRMAEGLDTEPILLMEKIVIAGDATAASLRAMLALRGAKLVCDALDRIEALTPQPQPTEGVTYAKKIARDEGRIDWRKPAAEIERQVRALDCWFEVKSERIKLLASALAEGSAPPGTVLDAAPVVACGAGALKLLTLQRPGRAPLDGAAFLRGFALPPGTILPCPATS
jgi:methionyl-tRNA formyltransferase